MQWHTPLRHTAAVCRSYNRAGLRQTDLRNDQKRVTFWGVSEVNSFVIVGEEDSILLDAIPQMKAVIGFLLQSTVTYCENVCHVQQYQKEKFKNWLWNNNIHLKIIY